MTTTYNKFLNNDSNRLGKELQNSTNLSKIMKSGVATAQPIWEMLGITEDEYIIKYPSKKFVLKKDSSGNDT